MAEDLTTAHFDRAVPSPADAIDAMMPAEVIRPSSVDQLRECLIQANGSRQALVFTGNRSKIAWGCPPDRLDLVVNLAQLPRFIEHAASDLVVRASASTNLDDLQTELARSNQRLAVDTVVTGTSVGGLIATGIAGPLRYGFGAVRDLVIGITVVRADGVRASSGGKVVKNVAGYDLAKLYTSSYGTLGAITEAYFRLHTLPELSHYVLADLYLPNTKEALGALMRSPLALSAIEIYHNTVDTHLTVGVLVEGIRQSVHARTAMVEQLLGPSTKVTADRPAWWGRLPGATTLKVTTEIAQVLKIIDAIRQISVANDLPITVSGSAGVGVLFVGTDIVDESQDVQIETFVRVIREASTAAGGTTIVLQAPVNTRRSVDVWGPIPALSVMERVKAQFDPAYVLSPGRFVGGI